MNPSVLAVTSLDDMTADLVLLELHGRGIPVVRLDPGVDFPDSVRVAARFTADGMTGTLATATRELGLRDVRSVYWRRPTAHTPPGSDGAARWSADQAQFGLGGIITALPGAAYVNHPWRVRAAEYKPAQLAAAAACGFALPPTLITNDPHAACSFAEQVGPIVYKPLWSTAFRVEGGSPGAIWTRTVEPSELDETISGTAHLFQQQVPKVADVRVTVVGDEMFAVRIDGAPGLDWRRDYDALAYTTVETPPVVADCLRSYLDHFDLVFGAFDFGLTADGDWVFFECNPNGQWAWFPDPIPQHIAAALANQLAHPVRGSVHDR